MRFVLLTLLSLCLGLGLGWYLGHGSRAELRAERNAALSAQSRTECAPPPPVNLGSCAVAIDPEVLRAELARALGNAGTVPAGAAPAEGPAPNQEAAPPPSPSQVAAFDKARTVVERVTTQGSMTREQALQMRGLLASVDPDSRLDLMQKMVRAMNQGKLTVEDNLPPF